MVSAPGAVVPETATVRVTLALAPAFSEADPELGVTVIPEPDGGAADHFRVSRPPLGSVLVLVSVTLALLPGAITSAPGLTAVVTSGGVTASSANTAPIVGCALIGETSTASDVL